jgi:hypothetical protein
MWTCTSQLRDGGRTQHFIPRRDGSPVRYSDVIRYWQDDENFRSFLVSLLSEASFSGYRWETPPITATTADREFEFVLLDEPGLERALDAQLFAEQFRSASSEQSVLAFSNLGNDALLIVPRPLAPAAAYGHLAAFVRNAPVAQKHELWRVVGATMQARLSAKPVWLSTAGMGVSWLHVRLDSRPKYYSFGPYRESPGRLVK